MKNLKSLSYCMMALLVFGSFAPFATAVVSNQGFAGNNYGSTTNTWQSSRPTFDSFYSGSMDTYWPILTRLENDQCNATNSDFVIMIPPFGCEPQVVRSDLLAEQNVPVFCQLSAIRINPLIDVSTIKSISFKGDYPDEVAGISFHPARAAVNSYRTLIGDPIEENIGYVVIVLKRQPDERNLEEHISGMLTATVKYDAQGAFGTGSGEYYLEPTSDEVWTGQAEASSFWGGKGYLRVTNVDSNEATIEVLTSKNDVYRTVTLKEGETSSSIYYPGQYCTASLRLKLNAIDNSEDMAKIDIEGDSYWVRKGSKILDGKCTVKSLNVFPNRGGDIEISCSGSSVFKLVLTDKGVVLNNGTTNIPVMIGGLIKKDKASYYLGYYGTNKELKIPEKNPNGDFVVLFNEVLSQADVSQITNVYDNGNFKNGKTDLDKALNGISKFDKKYEVVPMGGEEYGITFVSRNTGLSGGKYKEPLIPHYMELAENATLQLIENFPAEKKENGEYWGEDALYKQIALAGEVEDAVMKLELINLFLDKYPGSKNTEYIRDLKVKLGVYNYEGSSKNVFVNNDNFNIRVDGFVSGSGASDSVNIRMGSGAIHNLKRGKIYDGSWTEITEKEKIEIDKIFPRLTVTDIDGKGARFSYVWQEDEKNKKKDSKTFRIEVGSYLNVGGVTFYVSDTQVREVAYISLIPEIKNTKTEANFTFNIGVEKRAIELSPEMAQKKVDALNKSIADWEDRLEKLGKLITGLKGACLGISTVLMLKNMLTGFAGGTASARKPVMDYYEKKCREDGYDNSNLQECYNTKYKDNIETAIKIYGEAVVRVNEKVKCARNAGVDKNIIEGSKVVNEVEYIKELKKCTKSAGGDVQINGVDIEWNDLNEAQDFQSVLLYKDLCEPLKNEAACDMANETMQKQLFNNVEAKKAIDDADKVKSKIGIALDFSANSNKDSRATYYKIASQNIPNDDNTKIKKDTKFVDLTFEGKKYIVTLGEGNSVKDVYEYNGENLAEASKEDLNALKTGIQNSFIFIAPADSNSCSNTITTPYVKYHEKLNKQGPVAIVPFDKKDGWYAFIPESSYDDSVQLTGGFSICNVGADHKIDDGPGRGDICASFQIASGSKTYFTPCLSKSEKEIEKLYRLAMDKINEANRNKNGVTLDGKFIPSITPFAPASVGADCTDFMTLDDCALMFNVCDPVICPSSRCNLGGAAPVSDVIGSGIIGSLVLCLPNFGNPAEGKVAIPICLSGVHAGLDSYVSILKSYKGCLEKNIATGEYVGICDEITSIYMCEFFWGQLSPMLDILLVKFVEGLYGGFQVRGGAEYLTIQKSFENLDNSINYFASTYTNGALRAFSVGSTEEIGSMICKGFAGSSVPTSADMLDSFLKPDSPTQFYAYFSDTVLSEATVPSTSHYKVYYHIYAGNDEGAQFRVYLKSPPESSYYSSRPTLLVKSGYAEKGVAADEAVDFTAPTGYKELCVSINGQDECGFGSVTSDFGLDYVSQQYVADQADDRNIVRTEDCVTTSTSAWGMANPNLQAGVEKSLGGDDIATTGIIRVCASTNPTAGVISGNDVYCETGKNVPKEGVPDSNPKCGDGYICKSTAVGEEKAVSGPGVCKSISGEESQVSMGNWIDVGYCDMPTMRCWLDKSSVKDNLGIYMVMNNITSVDDLVRDSKGLKDTKDNYKDTREKLGAQRQAIKELVFNDEILKSRDKTKIEAEIKAEIGGIIEELDSVAGIEEEYTGQGTNADKAEALALKASVYMTVVKALVRENPELRAVGGKVVSEVVVGEGKCEDCKPDVSWWEKPRLSCNKEDCEAHIEAIKKECMWSEFSGCRDKVVVGEVEVSGNEVEVKNGKSIKECQINIGDRILKIIESEGIKTKYGISDRLVKQDIRVENFECLVLQIAMQESSLRHCEIVGDDCFVCNNDKSLNNLIKSSGDESSYGIMQINVADSANPDMKNKVYDFEKSVKYAVEDVLVKWGYKGQGAGRTYGDTTYHGWQAALMYYNLGGKGENNGYADKVLKQQGIISKMFPAACGGGDVEPTNEECGPGMENCVKSK